MERASKASRAEQANKWAVQANEQMDEQVAQYLGSDSWLFWTTVHDLHWVWTVADFQSWKIFVDKFVLGHGKEELEAPRDDADEAQEGSQQHQQRNHWKMRFSELEQLNYCKTLHSINLSKGFQSDFASLIYLG